MKILTILALALLVSCGGKETQHAKSPETAAVAVQLPVLANSFDFAA